MKMNAKHKALVSVFAENPTMTYNQVALLSGRSAGFCRIVYNELVRTKNHIPVGYEHTTLNRKVRQPMTDEIELSVIQAFSANPGMPIPKIAELTTCSFGACYRIHDKAVSARKITTHRKRRTSVANGPPLYVRGK